MMKLWAQMSTATKTSKERPSSRRRFCTEWRGHPPPRPESLTRLRFGFRGSLKLERRWKHIHARCSSDMDGLTAHQGYVSHALQHPGLASRLFGRGVRSVYHTRVLHPAWRTTIHDSRPPPISCHLGHKAAVQAWRGSLSGTTAYANDTVSMGPRPPRTSFELCCTNNLLGGGPVVYFEAQTWPPEARHGETQIAHFITESSRSKESTHASLSVRLYGLGAG